MGVSLEGIEKEKAEKRLKAAQFKPGNKIQRTRLLERPSSREEGREQPQKQQSRRKSNREAEEKERYVTLKVLMVS